MGNNKKYKGSLGLDWINKDLSLYYEIDEKEGIGVKPSWVLKNDIRVAEPRVLKFISQYGDSLAQNMLIKGDNLLVLKSLVELFKERQDKDKAKCIYIDPPFNTGSAFEYYDDNLKHSEWLTLMRDRLNLLKKLLRSDGVMYVHIDDEEMSYLKVLLDEILGRENYIRTISYQRSSSAGIGQSGALILNTTEFILVYANNKNKCKFNDVYNYFEIDLETMKRYNAILVKNGNKKLIKKFFSKSNKEEVKIYKHENYEIKKISLKNFEDNIKKIKQAFKTNFSSIFRTTNPQSDFQQELIKYMSSGLYSVDYIPSRGLKKGQETTNYFFNKGLCAWLQDTAEIKNNTIYKKEKINDFWAHEEIPKADLANEGGVEFQRSKKPEQLIKRIISLSSNENDLILDSFAGSGTTGAVAHKMNRRWIMVEMGKHAAGLILPRMKRVVDGKDKSGVTTDVKWVSGGGFNFYELGDSVIYEKDMNWKMKAEEMAEAVFLHFQYRLEKCKTIEDGMMFLGKHRATSHHFALCIASREVTFITEKQYGKIIEYLDKEKCFRHLTIFTNIPLAVSPEVIDERILIEKIPAKILREYNLL